MNKNTMILFTRNSMGDIIAAMSSADKVISV